MLRTVALLLLPIALLAAACGGPNEPPSAELDPPGAESDPPASALDDDIEGDGPGATAAPPSTDGDRQTSGLDAGLVGDGSGTLDSLFGGFDPFTMMGGLDLAAGFPGMSQEVDPALKGALLDEGDLPGEFQFSEEFSFSIPGDVASMELAARIFATGDLESDDPGAMVMSMAMALPPEAWEELGSIEDMSGEIDRSFDEFGMGEMLGFDGFELLDASGLGDGGFGMRLELDLSAMLGAFTEGFSLDGADIQFEQPEMPIATGIGMEMYLFFRDPQILAVMVMWPLDAQPNVDALALAETMDAKAAALE